MKKHFLITAFGKDRPGMVAGITEALYALSGNLEDASMTRLGGEFTMMMVASVPAKVSPAGLQKALNPWSRKLALSFQVKPITSALSKNRSTSEAQYLLSVYGTDRPGIVAQVTRAIADRKMSITDLQTRVLHANQKPVYILLVELQAPPKSDMDGLREELDQIRQSLGIEITLQDIDPVAL